MSGGETPPGVIPKNYAREVGEPRGRFAVAVDLCAGIGGISSAPRRTLHIGGPVGRCKGRNKVFPRR